MVKRISILLIFLSAAIQLLAQSQGINYQAVLISENAKEIPGVDVEGNYMPNQALTMRFSIIDQDGILNYQEEHQTQTDEYGMINLVIGEGEVTAESPGNFDDIDWDGLPKNLLVEISLGELAANFEVFSEDSLWFVPYAYHRNITATGTMKIDGASTLNDSLTVTNGSPVDFSGTLNVDGNTALNNELSVEGNTNLNSELSVGGNSILSGNLTVSQTTNLQNTLTVDAESNLNGQVTINADVNGSQSSKSSYPLRIQGSDQGIAITVDGDRNTGKNFITFWDADGAQGRIEGQTLDELQNSFDYIWDKAYETLTLTTQTLLVAADLVGVDDADASILEAALVVAEGIDYNEKRNQIEEDVGIVFESGGADYAEWLKKSSANELFSYGDIVGVKGGEIAKNMPDADNYMVVSKNPVILGNMPPKGEEELYEKVAFMGQVPVKVRGIVNIGDYIVASGLGDGFGKAISPENLSFDNYDKIVGVAWSASGGNGSYSMINVAIGINTGTMTAMIKQQQQEIQQLKQQQNKIEDFLASKYPDYKKTSNKNKMPVEKQVVSTTNNININAKNKKVMVAKILRNNPDILQDILSRTREDLDKKGINYKMYEQTNDLVNNPDYFLKVLEEK